MNLGILTVKLTNKTVNLFKKPRSTALISDEVKTALERAVYEKENGRYREALYIVDGVLKDDPNIPVATFIKAAILWEGFKDSYTAKLGLQRVKMLVPKKNDKFNQMASELMKEIERSRNYNL
jgi:hypothetical protein